jgi:hypothetical protein
MKVILNPELEVEFSMRSERAMIAWAFPHTMAASSTRLLRRFLNASSFRTQPSRR